jgi:hypothetical protein
LRVPLPGTLGMRASTPDRASVASEGFEIDGAWKSSAYHLPQSIALPRGPLVMPSPVRPVERRVCRLATLSLGGIPADRHRPISRPSQSDLRPELGWLSPPIAFPLAVLRMFPTLGSARPQNIIAVHWPVRYPLLDAAQNCQMPNPSLGSRPRIAMCGTRPHSVRLVIREAT